ncbi:MAG TPA: flavin reductase family protein [Anaerolineaceae bacterium]|jgi:flavin reductase (DIM6/NTAB) family NADH-FMN oxidoreductase RutF
MSKLGEDLRCAMRHWVTGVSIVSSRFEDVSHGMTVNSLASVSLEPPIVLVSLQHATRTYRLVIQSHIAGITILAENQSEISDRFAGKIPEREDRFAGVETFTWETGAPLISGGLAFLDCRVRTECPLGQSTLFLLDVVASRPAENDPPLLYFNRTYQRICP